MSGMHLVVWGLVCVSITSFQFCAWQRWLLGLPLARSVLALVFETGVATFVVLALGIAPIPVIASLVIGAALSIFYEKVIRSWIYRQVEQGNLNHPRSAAAFPDTSVPDPDHRPGQHCNVLT